MSQSRFDQQRREEGRADTPVQEPSALEPRTALASAELTALNERHTFSRRVPGAGLLGKLRSRLRDWLLGDYLEEEAKFVAHLVRHLNEVASRLEESLIRLEDRRDGGLHALERRSALRIDDLSQELSRSIGQISRVEAELDARLKTVESVARGLERLVASLRAPERNDGVGNSMAGAEELSLPDPRYLLLENRYRGSEEEISRRLEIYPPVFGKPALPVFELGGGRGELQRAFRAAGTPCYSVELDSAMVARCHEEGLDVRHGDGIEHLASLPDRSLGGFIAIQVVEHLPYPVLARLLELVAAKLAPEATAVFETINSESLLALSRNYFRDPTHAAPLHPETLRFLVDTAGLEVTEVRRLSPYPDGAKLQEISFDPQLTPRWRGVIDVMNHNIRQLNDIFFGYQDYAIIAKAGRR